MKLCWEAMGGALGSCVRGPLILFLFLSCQYFFSNSSIAFCAFSKFSLPSQVLDSAMNPFQYTKYLSFPLIHHLFKIFSILYFSFPLIMTGAGCFFLCSSTCFTYLHILLMLTVRGHSEVSQNTLVISGGGILSQINK